jgi:hypothetical protein|tara:strand:- start:40 stop:738 length:699 start_codon:yes stop_codon:yes gene_type:complete
VLITPAILGAICVALIGAFATMCGLLIAKENKTSEFRQVWIDALRSEISQLLVQFNAIQDATKLNYQDLDTKVSVLGPLYADLNEATFKISLRLNSEEVLSQRVLRALNDLQQMGLDEGRLTSSDITPLEAELLEASKELLKAEWKRVKAGEPIYRLVKNVSLVVAPIMLLLFAVSVFLLATGYGHPQPSNQEFGSEGHGPQISAPVRITPTPVVAPDALAAEVVAPTQQVP